MLCGDGQRAPVAAARRVRRSGRGRLCEAGGSAANRRVKVQVAPEHVQLHAHVHVHEHGAPQPCEAPHERAPGERVPELELLLGAHGISPLARLAQLPCDLPNVRECEEPRAHVRQQRRQRRVVCDELHAVKVPREVLLGALLRIARLLDEARALRLPVRLVRVRDAVRDRRRARCARNPPQRARHRRRQVRRHPPATPGARGVRRGWVGGGGVVQTRCAPHVPVHATFFLIPRVNQKPHAF